MGEYEGDVIQFGCRLIVLVSHHPGDGERDPVQKRLVPELGIVAHHPHLPGQAVEAVGGGQEDGLVRLELNESGAAPLVPLCLQPAEPGHLPRPHPAPTQDPRLLHAGRDLGQTAASSNSVRLSKP